LSGNCLPRPIMILGAPRSGTSLIQQIVRGCDGCAAVASEAQSIWAQYTHPAQHGWVGEKWAAESVDDCQRLAIRREFARNALPAHVWHRFDKASVMERQRRLGVPSWALRFAYRVWLGARKAVRSPAWRLRLAEKSVHAGLWPGLVEYVFPDVCFVHVVRDPEATIDSIGRGWRAPGRFDTYSLPQDSLSTAGQPRTWKFPLPTGWQHYLSSPLSDIAAFQWVSIQESILAHARCSEAPYLRLRLEDLIASPRRELERLAEFVELPWQPQLERYGSAVPRVNADVETDRVSRLTVNDGHLSQRLKALADEFGYSY
jgi:hypothetical protein